MAAALLLTTTTSVAQRWTRELSVDALVTATDNGNLAATGGEQEDVIAQISPRFAFRGEGARVLITGAGDLTYLRYNEDAARSRFSPQGNLLGRLEAMERFLFVEASASATRTAADPFGPRPTESSTVNTETLAQYRLSPYVTGRLSDTLRYSLRSDNTWTDASGELSAASQAYASIHAAEMVREAQPVGFLVRVERRDTKFENELIRRQTEESARVSLRYAVRDNLVLGIRGGSERNNYFQDEVEDSIEGVDFSWHPTERTDLTGFWERRFVGDNWQLSFTHRNPRLTWNVQLLRALASAPLSFLTLPVGGDVASLLDALLTTRYPDPLQRLQAVQDLMARQGLPSQLAAPFLLVSQQVNLYNSKSASVAYTGVRTALALNVYQLQTEALGADPLSALAVPTVETRQRGVGLTLSRRVSPLTILAATGTWARVHGLGSSLGEDSKQRTYRLQATRQLGAKSTGYVGVRRDGLDSTVAGNVRETAVFLGVGHRF